MLFTGIPYFPNLSLLPQITSKWAREKAPAMALETLGAPTSNHDGAGYFWEATKDTVAEGLNAVVLFSLATSLRHLHVLQTASSGSFIAAAPSSGVGRKKEYRDDLTMKGMKWEMSIGPTTLRVKMTHAPNLEDLGSGPFYRSIGNFSTLTRP